MNKRRKTHKIQIIIQFRIFQILCWFRFKFCVFYNFKERKDEWYQKWKWFKWSKFKFSRIIRSISCSLDSIHFYHFLSSFLVNFFLFWFCPIMFQCLYVFYIATIWIFETLNFDINWHWYLRHCHHVHRYLHTFCH